MDIVNMYTFSNNVRVSFNRPRVPDVCVYLSARKPHTALSTLMSFLHGGEFNNRGSLYKPECISSRFRLMQMTHSDKSINYSIL